MVLMLMKLELLARNIYPWISRDSLVVMVLASQPVRGPKFNSRSQRRV